MDFREKGWLFEAFQDKGGWLITVSTQFFCTQDFEPRFGPDVDDIARLEATSDLLLQQLPDVKETLGAMYRETQPTDRHRHGRKN